MGKLQDLIARVDDPGLREEIRREAERAGLAPLMVESWDPGIGPSQTVVTLYSTPSVPRVSYHDSINGCFICERGASPVVLCASCRARADRRQWRSGLELGDLFAWYRDGRTAEGWCERKSRWRMPVRAYTRTAGDVGPSGRRHALMGMRGD